MDRRLLAKVDRRLLSEMDHADAVQLAKVPVSDAVWSTWRRYCDAVGVTMGRGLAVLLHRELAAVVDEDLDGLAAKLEQREAEIAAREAELADIEKELGRRQMEVAVRERRVAKAERRAQRESGSRTTPTRGRNEPCWCGSGKKYKHCHG